MMYDFSNFFCSKKQGFTFVEILVACSIIIALAVGAIFLGSAILDNGRYNKAKTDTATISTAIGQYKLKDPWGNDYHFSVNTSTGRFAVWSNGHNKTNDTGSFNDSISGDDIGIMGH